MTLHGRRALSVAAVLGPVVFGLYSQSSSPISHLVVRSDPGAPPPAATALLRTTNDAGVLLSQTSIDATVGVRSGRLLIDDTPGIRTRIAIVNPSDQPAAATLTLRDADGAEIGRQIVRLPPGTQGAGFLPELLGFDAPATFTGTVAIDSDRPLAGVALREIVNGFGERMHSAAPMLDASCGPLSERSVVPHAAAGGGYSTAMTLINRSAQPVRGRLRWSASDGGERVFDIAPNGIYKTELVSTGSYLAGYVETLTDSGCPPASLAMLQIRSGGRLVSEAVSAPAATVRSGRVWIDSVGTRNEIAVSNPDAGPVAVRFTLLNRYGDRVADTDRTLPARSQLQVPADELFPAVVPGFLGSMRIEAASPVASSALRVITNSRSETILTLLPVHDSAARFGGPQVVPQVSLGGLISTRLLLLNPDSSIASGGVIEFLQADGRPAESPVYRLDAGGSRQLFPGGTAIVASIALRDPVSNQPTSEMTIPEGSPARPAVVVLDSTGAARDDIEPALSVTNPSVAAIDPGGTISGVRAGFTTLTLRAGGAIATGTVSVVGIDAGAAGYAAMGVAVDSSRRLYLASPADHTILLAQDLRQAPSVWAGTRGRPGLHDDVRLQSQFDSPAYIALNQANGSVFVSDSRNHVIRQIQPGASGRVTTVAVPSAALQNPLGVALDNRGRLWVADSGAHTISRVDLRTGVFETVAGTAGVAGFADGRGRNALFRSPAGIALERETVAEQLQREASGLPPQAVRILVADAGNGAIRRVFETGEVETIQTAGPAAFGRAGRSVRAARSAAPSLQAVRFESPAAVAGDASGTIYVSAANTVFGLVPGGGVFPAVPPNVVRKPLGIALPVAGRLVVADGEAGSREIRFGSPEIASVTPGRASNRGGTTVTIRGRNFAPETTVIVAGTVIPNAAVVDTETLEFTTPALPSGRTTLTVQNRGGLAQSSFVVDATPLDQLPSGQITTVAGGTTFSGDGGPAVEATVAQPEQVAIDAFGNTYVTDTVNHRVRRIDAVTGVITTVAGNGAAGFSGDNGPAPAASLLFPAGVAVDASGSVFIADTGNSRIRRVDASTGIITTVIGRQPGFSGDQGPAVLAQLNAPRGLAFDRSGNLYIADSTNHRVRRLTAAGIVTTVAGTGVATLSGDGGPATTAALNSPRAVATDASGNLWIADTFNHRIRRVDPAGGIQTVAVDSLSFPRGIAIDANGSVFISDSGNHRIRRLDPSGVLVPAAGSGAPGFSGDGLAPANAALNTPHGIAIDGSGLLVIADRGNNRVRKIVQSDSGRVSTPFGVFPGPRVIVTIAGNGQIDYLGDGGPAAAANLRSPAALAIDGSGDLFIADSANHRIRRVDRRSGEIFTIAGSGQSGLSGDGGPSTLASLNFPQGVAVDSRGNLYIADSNNHRIRQVDSSGTIRTLVVSGTGDSLSFPTGISTDASDTLFIADTGNNRILRIDTAGALSTVAGDGTARYSGDGGPATLASLNAPRFVRVDSLGNVFIADTANDRIRRVDSKTLTIATVAGNGERGFSGDGGVATEATLNFPLGVDINAAGDVIVLDSLNHRVRRVRVQTGVIDTIAGVGSPGFGGDNGPAAAALLFAPSCLRISSAGDILVADTVNQRIRGIRR